MTALGALPPVPSHARVAVVGGGIMGVGLLYHLALEGWRDIVLFEKGELTSGSTWHAAGQCPQFNGSLNMTRVHQYGTELYPKLEALTGQAVSWHGCGGLRLATTDDEVDWLRHVAGIARLAGYAGEIVGPEEIRRIHPFLDTAGVKAAFRTFTDGHVAPADVTNAMAAGARALGATICRRTRVADVSLLPSGEWLVETERGATVCEHVVNAAGSYADVVGAWTGHLVPIANMLHHYVITEPVKELIDHAPELPVVRDPYSNSYLREETNGILVGPYETATAHPCWDGAAPSWEFESELVQPELERIAPWLEKAAERFPLFGRAGVKSVISGAITHTPDGVYLSGPAAGPRNYWMHCGASIGICQGGGAGKYLAQWMVHGQAEISMREFDPRRFGPWATKAVTTEVAVEDYHKMYYCYRPGEQHHVGRDLIVSPVHERLKSLGGKFQQVNGRERARWFDAAGAGDDFSFRRPAQFAAVNAEAMAVRERVGLMELSTFAKFEVEGPGAAAFLDRILANRLPTREGGVVLAHLLNGNGFIEAELTVTRLAPDRFYVLSGAAARLHDLDHLRWRLAPGEDVTVRDATEERGVLILAGPRARDVLARLTNADLSNAAQPWLTARTATVAGVEDVRLLRMTYVGELGWELHVPLAGLAAVFDALRAADEVPLFGTMAMNALRMEKAYRGWGSELTPEVDMIEASMERFLRLDKPEFIGREATLTRQAKGPRIRLVLLDIAAADADSLGNEPVYSEGRLAGLTTGGAFGPATGRSLAFAYVEPALAAPGTRLDVTILGETRAATVLPDGPWDPENRRPRA